MWITSGRAMSARRCRARCRLIFGPLLGQRVSIYCDDTNLRSARVAERCGFQREGHIRANHRIGDYPVSGDYIYGLLRDEWLASGRGAAGGVGMRNWSHLGCGASGLSGAMKSVRWLGEIDRRELIEAVYHLEDGALVLRPERYDVQGWRQPPESWSG